MASLRNYRHEIEAALRGHAPEHIPFTIYDGGIIPAGLDLPALQRRGMALHARPPVFKQHTPNVRTESITEPGDVVRTVMHTPVGSLTSARRSAVLGSKLIEAPIKTLDDYPAAEFIARDTVYEPAYDTYLEAEARLGDAGLAIHHAPYSPLLEIQLLWLGQEAFCYEIADHEDAVMGLFKALRDAQRKMFDIVAKSPSRVVQYCGNVVPEMIGPTWLRRCVLPCWQEFNDRMHEAGKLTGCHLDADNRQMIDIIADSGFNFLEAFTPPPDCSVSVAEAAELWPGMVQWLNFPSSVFLFDDDTIRATTRELIRQAGDRKGFLLGVTEDIPEQHMQRGLSAILDVLDEAN